MRAAHLQVLIMMACLGAACTSQISSGGGQATAAVITVVPAGTSIPGSGNGTLPPFPTPEPGTPIPTLSGGSLSVIDLKYLILDRYPDFFFCDPDYYPVARADEGTLAEERFPELLRDYPQEVQAILAHNGLGGLTVFSAADKILVYREYKKLEALPLEPAGDHYSFQLTTGGEGQPTFSIEGSIDAAGKISVQQKTPTFATCPICLAAHTRIDTPAGPVDVEDIGVGERVWTINEKGERVAVPVVRTARVPVPGMHTVLHIQLEDGRELLASPGHPTSDGRLLGELQVGDVLDGARVAAVARVKYTDDATYDILPAGSTGAYWADGILLGSTLGP